MSRKEMEREFKRQLIARSARDLFLAKSYEEVTVQDIASAAEFGKGTIYQYFSSKEEILYYLLYQDMAESMENLRRDCSEPDACECLNIYISNQYDLYMRGNRLFLSFLRLMLEGNLKPEWINATGIIREQKLEFVAGIIARGQADGVFIEADSLQLARALKNVVRGFTMEQLELQKKETKNTNDIELIKAVIFTGIMRKDDSE